MTTVDHEVGNVAKCIRAGCQHVAVICTEQSRLEKIAKAVSGCLPAEATAGVAFYLPEQFIAHLKDLARMDAEGPVTPTQEALALNKYKVRRKASKLTKEESKTRGDTVFKVIADTMKKKE